MEEKISIIVPVYNEEKRIERCVKSILKQSYSNIEIVLVDDGSTDSSGAICDALTQKDERVIVVHKQNEGRVIARNEGLKRSSGDWIVYVDSDDWIEPGMLSAMVEVQKEHDVDVVIAPKMVRDDKVCGEYREPLEGVWDRKGILDIYWKIAPSMCSKLFRKKYLLECQFDVASSITYGEDMLCVRMCMLKVQSIYIMNRIFYHYTTNHGQRKYDDAYNENIFLLGTILRNHINEELQFEQTAQLILGVDAFVVKSITNFGLGIVFGKANKACVFAKINEIRELSRKNEVQGLNIHRELEAKLTREELWRWRLLRNQRIIQLYFVVRLSSLYKKIRHVIKARF